MKLANKPLALTGAILLALGAALAGCTPNNAATNGGKPAAATQQGFVTVTDGLNRQVTLAHKPTRAVVLSPSLLSFVAAVQGTAVGRVSIKVGTVPKSMEELPVVGTLANINMERVVELKPDLVIANSSQHEKYISLLDTNKIPTVALNPKTYDEVKAALVTIGKVYGNEKIALEKAKTMDEEIAKVVAKVPKKKVKMAVLFASPSNVTVELENSISGCIANLLGFTNVAVGSKALEGRPDKTPYSMESLVEKDPDCIFITTMGDAKKIENRLKADVQGNPAWASLRAVKNGKIYILPEKLFVLNPGLEYPRAVEEMAKQVYPEAF